MGGHAEGVRAPDGHEAGRVLYPHRENSSEELTGPTLGRHGS